MKRILCWFFGHDWARDFRFPEWMIVRHCCACGRLEARKP